MSAEVHVIAWGLFYASACAPEDMTGEEAAAAVERQMPAGTTKGWTLSGDPTFSTGQPNGCACEQEKGRRHWLCAA